VASDPSLSLHIVNALYLPEASGELLAEIKHPASKLGLVDRVTLVPDYLPDSESLRDLTQSNLVVFPYQQAGDSTSAAVRMGLATGSPVAVPPLPIFDDVREAIIRLPGTSVEGLVLGLENLTARIRSNSDADLEGIKQHVKVWRKKLPRTIPRGPDLKTTGKLGVSVYSAPLIAVEADLRYFVRYRLAEIESPLFLPEKSRRSILPGRILRGPQVVRY
jgi:hypothetical protein